MKPSHSHSSVALESLDAIAASREAYRQAAREFEKNGKEAEALEAFGQYLKYEKELNPSRNLFPELHRLFRKAQKIGEGEIAGYALNQIASTFLSQSAPLASLKYSTEALKCLQSAPKSSARYLALLNRVHALVILGRIDEAVVDISVVGGSADPEVKSGLEVLRLLIEQSGGGSNAKNRLPLLTDMERRLLALITEAPQNKFDLMEKLYGTVDSPEVLENRIKNLVSRVKKKRPNTVILENGHYRKIVTV